MNLNKKKYLENLEIIERKKYFETTFFLLVCKLDGQLKYSDNKDANPVQMPQIAEL